MKIKKQLLEQIIKEEIHNVLKEENVDEVLGALGAYAKDWAKQQWNKFRIDPSAKKQPAQQGAGPTSMGAQVGQQQAGQQVDQDAKTVADILQKSQIKPSGISEIDALVKKINTTKNAKEIQKIVDASVNALVMSGLQKLNSAYNIGNKQDQAKKLFDVSNQFQKSLKDFNALNIAAARIPISRQSAAQAGAQKANQQASAAVKAANKPAATNQQGLAAQLSQIPGAEKQHLATAAKQKQNPVAQQVNVNNVPAAQNMRSGAITRSAVQRSGGRIFGKKNN